MPTYRLLPHLRNLAATGRALAFVAIAVALATTLWLAPAIAQERTDTTIHTVQAGETLSEIAAQYGVNPDELLAINELDDPNAIFVGQQLTVPVAPVEPAPPGTHRVRLGETLTSIAARYDLAIGQLMRMNGIVNPDEVTAGQLLIVSSAVTPTPASQSEPTATSEAAATETPRPAIPSLS